MDFIQKYKDFFNVLMTAIFVFGITLWGVSTCSESNSNQLKRNQQTLLDSIKRYKVLDSLNAIYATSLELSLEEYKAHRAEDQEIIKKLKADKLTQITNLKTTTTDEIKVELKDTIVYNTNWLELKSVIADDSIHFNIVHHEELLLVESVRRKKFLFFKLPPKLFGFKSYELNIVSKNPNTVIDSVSWVKLETK